MAIYIEEFLFRGRAPGEAREPAWHVTLAEEVEIEGIGQRRFTRQLGVAAAAAAGWTLPDVIAAINAEALAEAEAGRAALAELEQVREAKAAAEADRDRALVERDRAMADGADREAEINGLGPAV
jgi:hypothetical protein